MDEHAEAQRVNNLYKVTEPISNRSKIRNPASDSDTSSAFFLFYHAEGLDACSWAEGH